MLDASLEVRSAVVYGSVIVVLVFLPVFLLDGLAGSFFRPLAMSYVLAIAASLLVALIVTPAMSLMLLAAGGARARVAAGLVAEVALSPAAAAPGCRADARARDHRGLADGHRRGLSVPRRRVPAALQGVRLPDALGREAGHLARRDARITLRASRELRAIPGVRNFGAHIGRAEVADEVVGINFTELWISLDPAVDYARTVARVQTVVDGYPGLQRDLLTYLRERIKEVLTGASATIVVRIFGPDLDVLARKAAEVGKAIGAVTAQPTSRCRR